MQAPGGQRRGGEEGKRRRERQGSGRSSAPGSSAAAVMLSAWDIKYLDVAGSLLRVGPVWAGRTCRRCIELCEEHGVWSCDESAAYPFATQDVEVDQVGKLREWLLSGGFVQSLQSIYWHAHRARISAFDDLFVVRYQAEEGGQVSL
jgi:hypothetical protein